MASYTEERFDLRGIETVVQIAGEGEPLVFLHGAGTVTGFDALLPLAERFKLIVPFHPGFGPSADDPTVDDIHDYRRHYLDLLRRARASRRSRWPATRWAAGWRPTSRPTTPSASSAWCWRRPGA